MAWLCPAYADREVRGPSKPRSRRLYDHIKYVPGLLRNWNHSCLRVNELGIGKKILQQGSPNSFHGNRGQLGTSNLRFFGFFYHDAVDRDKTDLFGLESKGITPETMEVMIAMTRTGRPESEETLRPTPPRRCWMGSRPR